MWVIAVMLTSEYALKSASVDWEAVKDLHNA